MLFGSLGWIPLSRASVEDAVDRTVALFLASKSTPASAEFLVNPRVDGTWVEFTTVVVIVGIN